MAKIRAVVVEMEGSDGTVLDAIRSFVGAEKSGGGAVAERTLPAAPLAQAAIEAAPLAEMWVAPGPDTDPKGRPEKKKGGRPKGFKVAKRAAETTAAAPAVDTGKLKHAPPAVGQPGGAKVQRVAAVTEKEPGCREQVYELLTARPLSSQALIVRLPRFTASSIYLALKELKAAGTVVVIEAADGEKQYKRVG